MNPITTLRDTSPDAATRAPYCRPPAASIGQIKNDAIRYLESDEYARTVYAAEEARYRYGFEPEPVARLEHGAPPAPVNGRLISVRAEMWQHNPERDRHVWAIPSAVTVPIDAYLWRRGDPVPRFT